MTTPATKTLRSAGDLEQAGFVTPERTGDIQTIAAKYAVAISPHMAQLIDRDDPADPIARQFLPDAAELVTLPEERADPIGDHVHSPVAGIVHRYPDRVLLKAVGVCPVYCRFCFRREMIGPGAGTTLSVGELSAAFAYIAARPQIWEVIVTGGDPLILSPRRLADIRDRTDAIDHVKVLRWHTRVPCIEPDRVTRELADAVASRHKTAVLAIHANHSRELTREALAAIKHLRAAGIMLVSQTVLLRGVNDSAATLAELMRGFVEAGVKPYYLHQGDMAPGTSHFRVPISEGRRIMAELRGQLSGIAQPTYVLDIPGGYGKVPIGPDYLEAGNVVTDSSGRQHLCEG